MFGKKKKNEIKKELKVEIINPIDYEFISEIQPQGGMVFKDKSIQKGDGYEACLDVYNYPTTQPPFWQNRLMQVEGHITTLDVSTQDKERTMRELNRSIDEQYARILEDKNNIVKQEASANIQQLTEIVNEISQQGEVIKVIRNRSYTGGATEKELEEKIDKQKKSLHGNGIQSQVMILEQEEEWKSIFYDYSEQQKWAYKRTGTPLPASSLGGSYFFHHTSLEDPRGFFLGETSTNGAVIYDRFYNDGKRRKYSHAFVLGNMRMGKSTLLKLQMEDDIKRNYFVRGFDKAGDFKQLVAENEGKYIDLSGKDGMINWLQVYATQTKSDNNLAVDEVASFNQHLNKCRIQMTYINAELSSTDLDEFSSILYSLYCHKGIWEKSIDNEYLNANYKITSLKNNEYPTLTELIDYLKKEYIEQVKLDNPTEQRIYRIETIRNTLEHMLMVHGSIFNGYTTVENIENEQVVFFDIESISNLAQPVFRCQLFTALTMIWNQALRNGREMKQKYEDGEIQIEDVRAFSVYIDECQNILNSDNYEAVRYMVNFQKEMPKFFGGVIYATQSPLEILSSSANTAVVEQLRQIFELCIYKFFFNLDYSVLQDIRTVLGDSLTESQYGRIPKLTQGQTIMAIGNESMQVNVYASPEQIKRFTGGI